MSKQVISFLLQLSGSILLLGGYFPQIIQLYKTKKSEDISLSFWVILTTGLFCIAFNMLISHVPNFIMVTQFLNAIIALWVLVLVKKYK
ncbi:PQ-loop repeat-containing protein (plasmid) [Clostridium botulinum]|uniref:PQ loop repeat protein n=1 Tax=Clostridium botulinum C/D str. DC5 TaxID=1443128 RepID=A0A0A0HXQ0_CLOBO|nr:PQ-loop domain-containing transporter [Clostridium botulinum]KGM93297.1 hypothetical protein Z955_15045 [Clostridium botulinum C/D str. DC5]KOC45519.1 hypothetical protein ADU88_13620 [Clostridium botulinum]KOC56834.1 hypothetical protein ADU89_01105 [Clostridium botulinum]KOC57309.1 hypothetical protein ADU90_05645 [Clostridium botulinum]MCD3232531.1 PQ-loop repeat-containing protein [Clostridium botulinum D/C]